MNLALTDCGLIFELTNYQSGADALLILCPLSDPLDSPIPDLILLDLNTPRCDGFEVLARLRANDRLSKVPVAIVTSSGSTADMKRAALNGATTYIQKPSDLSAYLKGVGTAVTDLLDNRKTLTA